MQEKHWTIFFLTCATVLAVISGVQGWKHYQSQIENAQLKQTIIDSAEKLNKAIKGSETAGNNRGGNIV